LDAFALVSHVPAPSAVPSAVVWQGTWQRLGHPAPKLWQTITSPHPSPRLQTFSEPNASGLRLQAGAPGAATAPPHAPAVHETVPLHERPPVEQLSEPL